MRVMTTSKIATMPPGANTPAFMSGWLCKRDLSAVYEIVDAPLVRRAGKTAAFYRVMQHSLRAADFFPTELEALAYMCGRLGYLYERQAGLARRREKLLDKGILQLRAAELKVGAERTDL